MNTFTDETRIPDIKYFWPWIIRIISDQSSTLENHHQYYTILSSHSAYHKRSMRNQATDGHRIRINLSIPFLVSGIHFPSTSPSHRTKEQDSIMAFHFFARYFEKYAAKSPMPLSRWIQRIHLTTSQPMFASATRRYDCSGLIMELATRAE